MLTYIVHQGESLWSIVYKYGLHPINSAINNIISKNGLGEPPNIYPKQRLAIPLEGLYYIAQPGDSLMHISKVFNIPVQELAVYNDISSHSLIYPGMIIKFSKN